MCKSKKILKLFSLFATLAFVFLCAMPSKVEAAYDQTLNKMLTGKDQFVVDPTATENNLVVTIQYQYGLRDIQVYVCKTNDNEASCMSGAMSTFKDLINFSDESAGMRIRTINATNQETISDVYTPGAPISGTSIKDYANGNYKFLVKAKFCNMRTADRRSCASWTQDQTLYFDIIEINGAFTGNSEVNNLISRVLTIINDYVIPILWVILGILLIVRGVILAIGIVKASDEAEVRAGKIKGFVWLAIGVLAGYAVTIGASWVMSVFGYGGLFS